VSLVYACNVHAQGVFVYDQQSSGEERIGSESGANIEFGQPLGQSFTPQLSRIGFIRIEMFDASPGSGLGTTVFINLRTNSINGTILASISVNIPSGFGSEAAMPL
jgi:hypothetical protein